MRVGDFGLGAHDFVDAGQRGGAPLEEVDDPSEGDYGPSELDHVGVEGDELANVHFVEQDLTATDPEHDYHGCAEHEFEGGPEHAH